MKQAGVRMRISLCMIARDEEELLGGALDSVVSWVDEIVVADTGSEDRTAAIARSYNAHVMDVPWEDDFSAARNAALAECTGDWVLVLDADERVAGPLVASLRRLPADAVAATVELRNRRRDGNIRTTRLIRAFRRHPQILFEKRIHEHVNESVDRFIAQRGGHIYHLEGRIDHLGYLAEVAANRHERDFHLLELAIRDEPEDTYNHFKMLERAASAGDAKRLTRAVRRAERAIAADEAFATRHYAGMMVTLMARGRHAGDPIGSLAYLRTWGRGLSKSVPLVLWEGLFYEQANLLNQAMNSFHRVLSLPVGTERQLSRIRPLMGAVRICLAKGDLARADAYYRRAVAVNPYDREVLSVSRMFSQEAGSTDKC